jgi:hypothetical protein
VIVFGTAESLALANPWDPGFFESSCLDEFAFFFRTSCRTIIERTLGAPSARLPDLIFGALTKISSLTLLLPLLLLLLLLLSG